MGNTTQANYQEVKAGKSALCQCNSELRIKREVLGINVPFPFTASLFTQEQINEISIDGYTLFESLAINSIRKALEECQIPINERTCLVISSTKLGGVQGVQEVQGVQRVQEIAHAVGITTTPIIVCNACISGVSALILGNRLIEMQQYDYVIVCGIDVQSTFIISGFQSLKALSETPCRPFDIDRTGLNLGEAAATIILSKDEKAGSWHITNAAIRNDAFHISSPSPKADGCLMAIETAIKGQNASELALINAHGTATLYNDQMEARGLSRAGLADIPTNALKGYYGHTMGAAGILETIITMHGLDDHTIIGTKGYNELGVSGNINIVKENTPIREVQGVQEVQEVQGLTPKGSRANCENKMFNVQCSMLNEQKTDFLKIISGFGGCNAAIYVSKKGPTPKSSCERRWKTSHSIVITPQKVVLDNEIIVTHEVLPIKEERKEEMLTFLYKTRINNYPKFYKMDALARLGFIATELLLQKERETEGELNQQDRAVIFFNQSSSEHADKVFLSSISDPENFFPSPSAFVYTLPNIVNGEIAIRNNYRGETAFYILPKKDDNIIRMITQATLLDGYHKSIITGWMEYKSESDFLAELTIVIGYRLENKQKQK